MYEHEPLKTENPARVTLSLLLPNHCYFPKPLCFQICSTSENVSPGVSGTNTITKITARTTIPTKIKKVTPVPAASTIDMNVCATIKLLIQLTVSDMPPHIPRYCCKYISEFTVHGTGPIPGAKKHVIELSQAQRALHQMVHYHRRAIVHDTVLIPVNC
ncbi:hypothetical protein Bca4012_002537 [Brassica carinata]